MKFLSAVMIGFLFVSGMCFAHVDRVIALSDNGTLTDIPAEYGPGNLHILYAPPGTSGASILSVDLRLGKNLVHLPICVTGLLQTRSNKDVSASASWYNDESILPYYLEVNFLDPGYDKTKWPNPGYSLLFNLHTGELMRMSVAIVRDGGKSIQEVPVDIIALCGSEQAKTFYRAAN